MSTFDLVTRIRADASQATREFGQVEGGFNKMGAAAKLGIGIAAAAVSMMVGESIKAFAAFDTKMREVFTLLPGISAEAMGAMTADVRAFSREYGLLTSEVVPALYQSISAGVPQENVFNFMETAAEVARGGVTDMKTAVDGLTTAVNAYGVNVLDAQDAADIMFTGMRLGKTTIGELSGALFQIIPVAASTGIGFDQITAALAAITLQGTPTAVAATNLRGAVVELGKEGTIAFEAFKDAAGVTFPAFIASGGTLQEALDLMAASATANGTTIQNAFGSIEGGMAATVLASTSGSAQFGTNMDAMAGRAGATDAAFETMTEGIGFSMDKFNAVMEDLKIGLAEDLMPALVALADLASSVFGANEEIERMIDLSADLNPVLRENFGMFGGMAVQMHINEQAAEALNIVLGDMAGAMTGGLSEGFRSAARTAVAMGTSVGGAATSMQGAVGQIVADALVMRERIAAATAGVVEAFTDLPAQVLEHEGDIQAAFQHIVDLEVATREFEANLALMTAQGMGTLADALEASPERAQAILMAEDFAHGVATAQGQEYASEMRIQAALGLFEWTQGLTADAARWQMAADFFFAQGAIDRRAYLAGLAGPSVPLEPPIIDLGGGHVGGQGGGIISRSGMLRVGEAGPESVFLPRGAGITPGRAEGGVNVSVYVAGSVVSEQDLADVVERQLILAARRGGLSEVI